MKIKLTTAEAIRLARLLNYNYASELVEEGGDRADYDLDAMDNVYDQLIVKLRERGLRAEGYDGMVLGTVEEMANGRED